MKERVALGRAPLRRNALLYGSRQAGEERRIFGEGQALLEWRLRASVGRAGEQASHQRRSVFRHVADAVTGIA